MVETISQELINLFQRDEAICWLCCGIVTHETASRDHVIPRSLGGPNRMSNYKLAHKECNVLRGNEECLPLHDQVIDILIECQDGRCSKCSRRKALTNIIRRQQSEKKFVLKIMCSDCFIPAQRVGN